MASPSGLPTNVLFVSAIWGTLNSFVRPLAHELASLGCRTIGAAGGPIVHGHIFDLQASLPEFRRRSPAHLLRAAQVLLRIVRRNDVELIYAQTPLGVLLGRFVTATTGVPLIAQIYGTFLGCGGNTERAFRTVERSTGRFGCATITLNQTDADYYRRFLEPTEVHMFPGVGVPEDRLRHASARVAQQDPSGPVVGAVARFTPEKGLDTVVASMRRLRDGGIDARLRLIGEQASGDAPWRPPDEPWIECTGWLDDPHAAVAGCDVLAAGSRREGFGQATAEALVMGLPVVAVTNAGSLQQKTLAGTRLTLVEPGDVEGFADAIGTALRTRGAREFQDDLARAWGTAANLRFHREVLAGLYPRARGLVLPADGSSSDGSGETGCSSDR